VRDQLDRETLDDIHEALASAQTAAKGNDPKLAQDARNGLEQATLPLAALLMDSVAKAALAGKKLDSL